jgi:hypothetical protein
MTDPAQDAIAAAIRAITGLVTGPPNLIAVVTRNDAPPDAQSSFFSDAHYLRL